MKKIWGNVRDQKLVGCLLHDSLGIDALKTIKMSDFSSVVEPEAEVSVKRIKKQWFIQCSQLPYLVRVRLELLKIKLPCYSQQTLYIFQMLYPLQILWLFHKRKQKVTFRNQLLIHQAPIYLQRRMKSCENWSSSHK